MVSWHCGSVILSDASKWPSTIDALYRGWAPAQQDRMRSSAETVKTMERYLEKVIFNWINKHSVWFHSLKLKLSLDINKKLRERNEVMVGSKRFICRLGCLVAWLPPFRPNVLVEQKKSCESTPAIHLFLVRLVSLNWSATAASFRIKVVPGFIKLREYWSVCGCTTVVYTTIDKSWSFYGSGSSRK